MNQTLNKAIKTLKLLLGLETPPPPAPPPPTILEQLKEEYAKIPTQEKPGYITKNIVEAKNSITDTLKNVPQNNLDTIITTGPTYSAITLGLEQVEALLFLLKEQNILSGIKESGVETGDKLEALHTLSLLLEKLAIPGKIFSEKLEQYLQKNEEQLILAEARGEYKLTVSENKKWVKLPLSQFLVNKKMDVKIPKTELANFFYSIPQTTLLELSTRVPATSTSLIDAKQLFTNKRVTPLNFGDEWYVLIV